MRYTVGKRVFGDWEIKKEIGSGSYGVVYEIEKNDNGKKVKSALKVIRIPSSKSELKTAMSEGMDEASITKYFEGCVKEIVKEVEVMSGLKNHPCVVAYQDHLVEKKPNEFGWYILIRMELLTSLEDYQLSHKMTEDEVIQMARDICNALVYCQEKQVIHRDIKPENIFVNKEGEFKLGDFGVARSLDKTRGGLSIKGTIGYMAPEVYLGKPYGLSVDTYSLGLMMYRFLNGNRMPFIPPAPKPITYQDKEDARVRRMQGDPLPPPIYGSEQLKEVVLKACAYHPSDRYKTAWEMLDALNRCGQKKYAEFEQDKGGTVGLWENMPPLEEVKILTPPEKLMDEEFSTEIHKTEDTKEKVKMKKVIGIAAVGLLLVCVLIVGIKWGQRKQTDKFVAYTQEELKKQQQETTEELLETISEAADLTLETETEMKETVENPNFGLSQKEKQEIISLAEGIAKKLRSQSMEDDYEEVWSIIESRYDWPEKVEIGGGELVHYENGYAIVDIPVRGDNTIMGLERIFMENGEKVDDVFIINSSDTYIHKSMEKGEFYLDDELYQLGISLFVQLQNNGWSTERENDSQEEWYYIWKEGMEKGEMGVLVENGFIKGIYIFNSEQIYRFRFDDSKSFFGDIGRFEIVNGYGTPNFINTRYMNYQKTSYLGDSLTFKFVYFGFRDVGIVYRMDE